MALLSNWFVHHRTGHPSCQEKVVAWCYQLRIDNCMGCCSYTSSALYTTVDGKIVENNFQASTLKKHFSNEQTKPNRISRMFI